MSRQIRKWWGIGQLCRQHPGHLPRCDQVFPQRAVVALPLVELELRLGKKEQLVRQFFRKFSSVPIASFTWS